MPVQEENRMRAEVFSAGLETVFLWNVDAAVGLNGGNGVDEVMFVQWCFYKMTKWNQIDSNLRAVFAKTPVTGECTGSDGDLLITSIKGLQQSELAKGRGAIVDGRVSPATGGGHYKYHGGQGTFLIFYLNAALRVLHPQQYPRIDLMPE